MVLEKTLVSPLDCKEIQPVHPKKDQGQVFIEGLMLKLKFQYFNHLMWRSYSFVKFQILWRIEGRRRRGWQRMRWSDGITNCMEMNLGKIQELVMDRDASKVQPQQDPWVSAGWTALARQRERQTDRQTRESDRQTERPGWRCAAESGKYLFFYCSFYILS